MRVSRREENDSVEGHDKHSAPQAEEDAPQPSCEAGMEAGKVEHGKVDAQHVRYGAE